MRADQLLTGKFVEAGSHALGPPPVVHEDARRPVRSDKFQELRVHSRPDALRAFVADAVDGPRGLVAVSPEVRHVFDGDDDFEVEVFRRTGISDADRAVTAKVL